MMAIVCTCTCEFYVVACIVHGTENADSVDPDLLPCRHMHGQAPL